MEKSTKTHRFKNRRCGSLAAIVTTTVHHGSSCHKHQTWAPQLWDSNVSDLLKVRWLRKSLLAATSHRGSRGNMHILNVDWRATVKFFSSHVKKMSTASVGTEATFFRTNQARCSLPPYVSRRFCWRHHVKCTLFANTSADNKRESVPQSDACAFGMMSSAKSSGFVYKTLFSFIT